MYLISLLGNGDTGKTTSFAKFLLKNNYFLEHQEEAVKNAKFDAEINGKPEDYYQFLLYVSPQEKIEERTIYTAQKIMAYYQGKIITFRTISYLKFTGEKYERVIIDSPYKDGFAKGYVTFSLQDIGGQFDLFDKQINGLRISDAVIYFADDKTTQKDAENHAKMISAFKLPTFVVINKEDILKEKAVDKLNMILT
ncbi:MAG: GTP-binding protein, partial [Acidianus infernus]|nr:GTP-binding protein [Acidianus infernus]